MEINILTNYKAFFYQQIDLEGAKETSLKIWQNKHDETWEICSKLGEHSDVPSSLNLRHLSDFIQMKYIKNYFFLSAIKGKMKQRR